MLLPVMREYPPTTNQIEDGDFALSLEIQPSLLHEAYIQRRRSMPITQILTEYLLDYHHLSLPTDARFFTNDDSLFVLSPHQKNGSETYYCTILTKMSKEQWRQEQLAIVEGGFKQFEQVPVFTYPT